jgi:hypothetical protein
MDKPVLVEADLKAGETLLRDLDQQHLDVTAALWLYSSDSNEWRLVIASPLYDAQGPMVAYRTVQPLVESLKNRFDIALQNISMVSPSNPLIRLLGAAIQTGPEISHIRVSRNTINNQYIEDAYIYRLPQATNN